MVGLDSGLALAKVDGRGAVVGMPDVTAVGEGLVKCWVVLGNAETRGKMGNHSTGMYVMHASTLYSSITQ